MAAEVIPVTDVEFQAATKVNTAHDLFNFISKSYMIKTAVPVIKVHNVEFYVKP